MNLTLIFLSATIILSPLYIIRSHFLIPTTLLEILLVITILLTAIDFWRSKSKIGSLRTSFDLANALVLITAIISTAVSFDVLGGLGILKAYFIEPVLFFYCLIYQGRKVGIKFIVVSFFIAGLWMSVLGLVQKLTGSFTLAPHEIIQGRISALYNSANSLALFLGPLAILALALFVNNKKNLFKLLSIFFFLFFSVIIFWTRSRGGLVAELISIIIFAYLILAAKISFFKKIWYILPVTLIVLISLFFYQLYLNYNFIPANVNHAVIQGDTLQIRYFIWAGTINLLKDYPIFGAGLSGFKPVYAQKYKLRQYPEDFQYPHNLVLTFWAETGILGLAAFLLLVVRAYSLILRNIFKDKSAVFGAGLAAMLSFWMLHGIVDVPYFKNDLSIEFWTLFALIALWFEHPHQEEL